MKRANIILLLLGIIIVFLVAWYHPVIFSIFQGSSSGSDTSPVTYTNVMIRSGKFSSPIDFGDAEYYFTYVMGSMTISAPFDSYLIQSPTIGRSYQKLGIEVRIANISSDYISDYIVIDVRPLTDSYMFDTYRYTKLTFHFETLKQ